MSTRMLAGLLLCACSHLAHAAPAAYQVRQLIPSTSEALDGVISPTAGFVVADYRAYAGAPVHTRIWSGTSSAHLQVPRTAFPSVAGVNDKRFAAGTINDAGLTRYQAVLWTPDGAAHALPSLNPGERTYANGIGAHGEVVGLESAAADNHWIPVVWRQGVPTALPIPAGKIGANAVAVSPGGLIAGRSYDALYAEQAVLWTDGVPASVGPARGIPHAVNDAGQVAGEVNMMPFVATAWGTTMLPLLPRHDYGVAQAINGQGVVVGLSQGAYPSSAVRWVDGQVEDLNGLLVPGSLPAGWSVTRGLSIDEAGDIVAGAIRNDGVWTVVVLVPVQP